MPLPLYYLVPFGIFDSKDIECFCLVPGDPYFFAMAALLSQSPCDYLALTTARCTIRCVQSAEDLFHIAAIALTLVFIGLLDRTQTALHLSALLQQIGIAEVGSCSDLMRIR